MVISIDSDNVFEKTGHTFIIKELMKLRTEES
jgi:hypothetical protein